MSKRWKPQNIYYYFNLIGEVASTRWDGDALDETYYEFGNCFETKEQAEAAAAKVKELLLGMSVESGASSAHFPKLTVSVFDLPECPEWASYAAVDAAGEVWAFALEPYLNEENSCWVCQADDYESSVFIAAGYDATDWQNSLTERPERSFPKLTAEVFDRPDCPKWAKYAAVDEDGTVALFEHRPTIALVGKWWDRVGKYCPLDGRYDNLNWRNSLIERPERSFPKLTEEVFDRQDCPEWAKYAAVGNSGYAYWFKNKPIPGIDKSTISNLVAWTLYDSKQLIPGLWDSSDWQNSLIERPKPKLTEEVFNLTYCPKNVQYAVVTSKGRVVGYTSKPYINKEYDCWGFNEGCSFTISVDGTFDSTDWQNSLVERPAKLPAWCKINAVCWHKRCGYFKVTYIDDVSKRVDIQQVEDSSRGYLSFNTVCNEAKPARPRPYNEKEMQKLVGKVIDTPDGYLLVDAYSKRDSDIHTADGWFTADYLMLADYTIDGELCHVLEHLEEGEWVR